MSVPILLAVTDPAWEASVVAQSRPGHPVEVARRCVDVADLLAAAAAGIGRVAVVSAELRRLDRDVLTRLAVAGVAVVGLAATGDEDGERRLRQLGVRQTVAADDPPTALAAAVLAALAEPVTGGELDWAEPRSAVADASIGGPPPAYDVADADAPWQVGGDRPVIAVWGPAGAPGRSTIAVNLAAELARLSGSALLVDADVHAASIAQLLGLLDEAPGLAAACRLANAGRLDVPSAADVAVAIRGGLRVLTGLPRPDRWPELKPASVTATLEVSRRLAAATVVDLSASLEQDEELSYDTAAPRRNGATLAVLDAADVVVAVAAADPVGLQRFVRAVAELREAAPEATIHPVVNRLRRGAVPGGDPRQEIAAALERYAGLRDPWFLPDDRAACDLALAGGRTLAEAASGSPLRTAIASLAADLAVRHAGVPGDRVRAPRRRRPARRGRLRQAVR